MREILFRGKRLDNGEWIEGYYVRATHHWHKHGVHEDWIIAGAAANGGWFAIHERRAVDPATVGQYTGLTDMQGVKIFEGDVVTMAEEYGKIEYSETEAMFQVVFDTWCTDFDHYFGTDFEVIGNIHDNPELLEG